MRALAILGLASGVIVASGLALANAEAAPLENCLKAEAAYQAGRHEAEVTLYTRCIEEDDPTGNNLAIAYNNRGVAQLAMGDAEGAIADYDRALTLDSAYAMAYTNRGMAHLARGDFVKSLQDYDTALQFDPAYAPAYAHRCWLFGFMGHGTAALADCEESLRLRPQHPATLDSRAFAHWILEDEVKARRDLEMAWVLDPTRPTWEARFAAFERRFSIGYPYLTTPVRSADRQADANRQAASQEPAALPARPH